MKIQIDDIEREATSAEGALIDKIQQDAQDRERLIEERRAARESARAKLAALGLSEAEVAALLGA